ncbi:MAG: hypothetical protein IVW57_02325 [Ktedonobacterales bacterium]|nr:hypothetical protein [Ktedonobacterales bacterium]
MRETSLRWGLGMGAVGAGAGIVSLLIGTALTPLQQQSTRPEQLVVVLFLRGMVVLLFLGVVLGLAYYTGERVERAHPWALVQPPSGHTSSFSANRARALDAAGAGGLVLIGYWIATTLYLYAAASASGRGPFLAFVGSRLFFGAICLLLGAGMGSLGARAEATRRLLQGRAALTPEAEEAPISDAPAETPAPAE